MTIRTASAVDAAAIAAIYDPIVRDTTISFETDMPGEAGMRARWRQGGSGRALPLRLPGG